MNFVAGSGVGCRSGLQSLISHQLLPFRHFTMGRQCPIRKAVANPLPISTDTPCYSQTHTSALYSYFAHNTVRFELPHASEVTLEVFDVSGKRIRVLVGGADIAAGSQEVMWNGQSSLSAGPGQMLGAILLRGRGQAHLLQPPLRLRCTSSRQMSRLPVRLLSF